jgi:hypothetical protein
MTSSNLTPNDYIIVQRGNTNYRISGDQILNFSREQIGPELDELRLDLDQEVVLRENGDEALRLKYEQMVIRLEDIVNNLLPVHTQDTWKYKIEFAAAAEFALGYQSCSGEELGPNPINDPPLRCYDTAIGDYHTLLADSVLNKPGAVFFSSYNLMLSGIDAVFVNRYTEFQAAAYDWEQRLKVGDYIQISGLNPTLDGNTIKDHEKYGIFRISSLLGDRTNSNVTADQKEPTRLYGFRVEPVVVAEGGFIINQLLQLQFMSNIKDWISEGFVSVEGDKMTGQLEIERTDPDGEPALTTNGKVHANEVLVDTALAFTGANGLVGYNEALLVSDPTGTGLQLDSQASNLTVHCNSGAKYAGIIELDDGKHLTHKHYVDSADTDLENQINNLSDRVDGLANIAKETVYKFEKYQACLDQPANDWVQCVVDNDGLSQESFQIKAGGGDQQSWGSATRILITNQYEGGQSFQWSSALSLNDVIEIAHNPEADSTIAYHYATYAVKAEVDGEDFITEVVLSDGSTAYEIQVEAMKSKGAPIDGESYYLNYYDRSNGLSLELVEEKFVSVTGDYMTGGLQIEFLDEGDSYLKCFDGANVKFEVIQGGDLLAGGGLEIGYGNPADTSTLRIAGGGSIVFRNELNIGSTYELIKLDSAPILSLAGNKLNVNNKHIINLVSARRENDGAKDALARNDIYDSIEVPSAGENDGLLTTIVKAWDSGTGVVTLKGGGARTVRELTDTDLPERNDGIARNDVLSWNGSKWKNKSIGENYGPGQNIFVDNEADCEVGGLWRTSGDNPSFYIRYK